MQTSAMLRHSDLWQALFIRLCYFSKLFWFALASLVLCVYVAASPQGSPWLYRVLLFPNCARYNSIGYSIKRASGITAQDCYFLAADGAKLHGWLFKKPGARMTVILDHGQCANVANCLGLAEDVLEADASVFLYDYEGYGRSQGRATVQGLCDSGVAAYKFLTEQKRIAAESIVQFGVSLGTGVACHVAASQKCAGVILMSPYKSLVQVGKDDYPPLRIYPDCLFNFGDIQTAGFFQKRHPPILMFAGVKDGITPVCQADELFACARPPIQYIRDASGGHCDAYLKHSQATIQKMHHFIAGLERPAGLPGHSPQTDCRLAAKP